MVRVVRRLTRGLTTPAEKANAVLRFVQDDVRYLAILFGESSYRPFPPDQVLRRRFGDCKDKSLLLVALLQQLGIKAEVALVHTAWKGHVRDLLPSPLAFDHAIFHVELPPRLESMPEMGGGSASDLPDRDGIKARAGNGFSLASAEAEFAPRQLWLDATATLQGGSFTHRFHGNFGCALVLAPGVTALQTIAPETAHDNEVAVRETYTVGSMSRPVRLDVVTTYRGGVADFYRLYRQLVSPTQNIRQLTGYLARFYPKVHAEGPVTWTDDRQTDVLTARSHFVLPEFWTVDQSGQNRVAAIGGWPILERLPRPQTVDRTAPFALAYPQRVIDDIDVRLPKAWAWKPEQGAINDDTFRFTYYSALQQRTGRIRYAWTTEADAVPADRIQSWIRKLTSVRERLGFGLTQNIRLAAALKQAGVVWPVLATLLLGGAAGLGLGLGLYRRWRRPRGADDEPPPIPVGSRTGIGGWLVVVALGVTFRPLANAYGLWPCLRLIDAHATWVARTDPASALHVSGFSALVLAEAFAGAAFLAWSGVLVVQFYRCKASLPRALATYLIVVAAWTVAHAAWYGGYPLATAKGMATNSSAVLGAIAVAAVWVPYLCFSRRVKATFVR